VERQNLRVDLRVADPAGADSELGALILTIYHDSSGNMDDSDGGEKISVVDKTGKNSVEVDSKSNSVTIKGTRVKS
jgi:hypothetical protein